MSIDLSDVDPTQCSNFRVMSPVYLRDPDNVSADIVCNIGDTVWMLRAVRSNDNTNTLTYFVHESGFVGYLVGNLQTLRSSRLIEIEVDWRRPPDFNRVVASRCDGDAMERLAGYGRT